MSWQLVCLYNMSASAKIEVYIFRPSTASIVESLTVGRTTRKMFPRDYGGFYLM